MKTLRKQLIFVCLLISSLLVAQSEQIFFEHLTTKDGLSQNDINGIYQDSRGFMWFGTHEGLNKFDGYSFTTYKPDPNKVGTINSNLAFAITEDQSANLWIGTTGSGLNFFDRRTELFSVIEHIPGDEKSLISNYITAIYVDDNNFLWVGTKEGLDYINLTKREEGFTHVEFPMIDREEVSLYVNALYDDQKGNVWIGTNHGLWKMSNPVDEIIPAASLIPLSDSVRSERVMSLHADKFGALIIGTRKGIYYQTEKGVNNTFVKFYDEVFRSIQTDEKNRIWAGSNVGLFCFKSIHHSSVPVFVAKYTNDPIDPNSLSKDVIRTVYADRTGMIWVGTNGGGLNKFFPEGKPFRVFRKSYHANSLSYNKIRTFYEDSNGTLWIGTEGGGLNYVSGQNDDRAYNAFKHISFPRKTFALEEVTLNKKRTLLLGAEGQPGFYQMNVDETDASYEPVPIREVNGFVFSLTQDFRGKIWIGTYQNGLYCWTPDAAKPEDRWRNFQHDVNDSTSLSNNIIRKVYEDSKGNIWIGTGHGLNKLSADEVSKARPTFVHFTLDPDDSTSISHNYILDIYEGSDEQLWIGTFGGGINSLDISKDSKQDHFVTYGEREGLPNQVIKSIQEDDAGFLWISTNKGLSKFDPIKKVFTNYDEHDGLQSNEFSELASLRRNDGEMLFGGVNGFNAFYPDQIYENNKLPSVIISELLIANKKVEVGQKVKGRVLLPSAISELEELQLKASENSFSIEFTALHFMAPAKNKFAYKLEGFDQDWIYTAADKRFATYTNLPPGIYTLMIKASNNDGLWNETPKQLRIKITPPFWLKWYAYVFYALLIIGFMFLYRRYTIIGIHEKHQLTLDKLKNEKTEEISKQKLQFFTNISHELRTPLTLIKGPLDNLLLNESVRQIPELNGKMSLMQRNTKYLLRLVNQILDFRKLDQGKMKLSLRQGDVVSFVSEVVETFSFLAKNKNIDIEIDKNTERIVLWFDPDVLEKVLYNLLSNACKFTPENGQITIKMTTVFEQQKEAAKQEALQHYFELRVMDTGPGISPQHAEHVFERFYQEDQKNKPGAGIGLAFSKSLVELHLGEIAIEQRQGGGACFLVKLPLNESVYQASDFSKAQLSSYQVFEETENRLGAELESEAVLTQNNEDKTALPLLLIIDDNADVRSFLHQGLQNDFRIIAAKNGGEGFEMCIQHLPDIIISDVMMPVLNGIALCAKIKADSRVSHIPIILLTAKSTEENELEGINCGADAYIRKPFSLEILRVKMANIIRFREDLKRRFRKESLLEPSEISAESSDEIFLQKTMEIMETYLSNPDLSVEFVAKEMGISKSKLYLQIKTLTGQSTNEFIRTIRLKRAAQLIERRDYSIKEIMSLTGFNTASYFSKCFKRQFGILPSEYAQQVKSKSELH